MLPILFVILALAALLVFDSTLDSPLGHNAGVPG